MLFTLGILKAMAPKGLPFTRVPLSEQPLTRSPRRARGLFGKLRAPCSSRPPVCHPLVWHPQPVLTGSCCWELGWASELCSSQGASSVPAGCRGSACRMLEFWMTNSYKTLASFLVNSTPEQQVAGRMAFKPRACLAPRCSQPLKSLAGSFLTQLLLLCLPRFPLEFQLSALSLLPGLW